MEDKNLGEVGKEHRGVPSIETKPTFTLRADPRIQEIRERLRKASTRPWIAVDGFEGENWLICSLGTSDDNKSYYVTTDCVHASEYIGDAKRDADFIANAPADIDYLLAALDTQRTKSDASSATNLEGTGARFVQHLPELLSTLEVAQEFVNKHLDYSESEFVMSKIDTALALLKDKNQG